MIIIDTNIYSALDNGSQDVIDALRGYASVCVPIVVIGELQYGFLNGSRQEENESRLDRFLAQDKVDIAYLSTSTAKLYAKLSLHCKLAGRALSNNDIWIAAIAIDSGASMVTYDKDFEVFSDMIGDGLVILSR